MLPMQESAHAKGLKIEDAHTTGMASTQSSQLNSDDVNIHIEVARLRKGESLEHPGEPPNSEFVNRCSTTQVDVQPQLE